MRQGALAAWLALGLAGCATETARAPAPQGVRPGPATAAAPAPPALRALERHAEPASAPPQSAVQLVLASESRDEAEEAAAPGTDFERGQASWYGSRMQGRRTASGERFDLNDFTAAHRTLPFGSMVCVHGLRSDRWVLVRINDRGPHARKRILDLSQAAAEALGMVGLGTMEVALSRPEAGRPRCGQSD